MVFASQNRRTRGGAFLLRGEPGGCSRASSQPPHGRVHSDPSAGRFSPAAVTPLSCSGVPSVTVPPALRCSYSAVSPRAAPAVGMGSLGHGAWSPQAATLLWGITSLPFPLSRPSSGLCSALPGAGCHFPSLLFARSSPSVLKTVLGRGPGHGCCAGLQPLVSLCHSGTFPFMSFF